jgi:AcrR family transcriptional regulator
MSPARARTSQAAIIGAARDLLEEGGLEAVSMAGVAERVGIKAPSLYKHFDDRSGLLAAVATEVALQLERALTDAVARSGADPATRLDALAVAYRSFALATPRAAALLFASVAPDVAPAPEAQAAAARPVLEVCEAIVGKARALSAARVLTAFAYGFTSMESAGAFRFGGDVEEAYRFGIAILAAGLERGAVDAPDAAATHAKA